MSEKHIFTIEIDKASLDAAMLRHPGATKRAIIQTALHVFNMLEEEEGRYFDVPTGRLKYEPSIGSAKVDEVRRKLFKDRASFDEIRNNEEVKKTAERLAKLSEDWDI